jgi:hypothetical protein
MLHVQWHASRHGAAGVKGLAVLTAHGDDQFHEYGEHALVPCRRPQTRNRFGKERK